MVQSIGDLDGTKNGQLGLTVENSQDSRRKDNGRKHLILMEDGITRVGG